MDSTYHFAKSTAALLLAGSLMLTSHTSAAANETTLFDFNTTSQMESWRIINDGVMGGLSQSQMQLSKNSTAIFQGEVSLENNGGFASVRTIPQEYNIAGYTGLRMRVKGDGRNYQVRLRINNRFDGAAYGYKFATKQNEWTVVEIPFSQTVPTFRGRVLMDYPALDAAQLMQVGFLIGNKVAEPFRLEVDWIKAYTD